MCVFAVYDVRGACYVLENRDGPDQVIIIIANAWQNGEQGNIFLNDWSTMMSKCPRESERANER